MSNLSDLLARIPLFTDNIMGVKVTIQSQVNVMMNHFGVVADSDPTSPGSQAEQFFTDKISAGVSFGAIVNEAVNFLSTDNVPAEFAEVAALLDNKALVSEVYVETNSPDDFALLVNVTATSPTIREDAIVFIDNFISGPIIDQTFTLTNEIDNLVGSNGNNIFIGDKNTTSIADTLVGGDGKDILQLSSANIAPNSSGIEQVLYTTPGGDISVADFADVTSVQGGSVTLLANGDYSYTPAAGFFGADSFEYTVNDGNGSSDVGTVNVTVNAAMGSTVDINLTIGTEDTGAYGNKYAGQTDEDGQITAGFISTGSDLNLSLVGYDVDYADEIEVLLNDDSLGFLRKGPNNSLNSGDSFSITAAQQQAGENIITFSQATNPTWIWGVTDILLQPLVSVTDKYISGSSDGSGFNIEINFEGTWTVELQQDFIASSEFLSDTIVGDLADVFFGGKVIDDIRIDATLEEIDGEGGILGQAGATAIRTSNSLPATAIMVFDIADATNFDALDLWDDIILHEMTHSVGFSAGIWELIGGLITGNDTSNPLFTGAGATSVYRSTLIDPTGINGVPLEAGEGAGTDFSHWDEETFDDELMTGFINSSNVFSDMTVAALEDMGYETVLFDSGTFL